MTQITIPCGIKMKMNLKEFTKCTETKNVNQNHVGLAGNIIDQ